MMRSSFARTLHEVKNCDGSLANALNNSETMTINAAPLLLETSLPNLSNQSIHKSVKKKHSLTHDNSLLPSAFYRRPVTADCDGDRFIPNRRAMDMDRAQFYLTQAAAVSDPSSLPKLTDRILEFSRKRPSAPGRDPAAHEKNKSKQSVRYIPTRPENVLDAPDLLNDYYLNLIDWSEQCNIAVALDRDVYLWNARSGGVQLLMTAGLREEHITSVRFSPHDGNILAVGTSMGRLQLWDVERTSLQRTMLRDDGDPARIPALAWRDHVVTSASRTGEIRHHDIRVAQHLEVCGLQWSPDDRFLASGGNDNLVCIYSASEAFKLSGGRPDHVFNEHMAAVKAIAWCPWKPTLLATGGGTRDHHLRFWNVYSGACVRTVDVETQVSGIIWNGEFRELITGHGSGSLCIWKYPHIQKVKELTEHQDRILSIVASPDKEMVASCSGDETIRIWHCFKVDKAKKRLEEQRNASIFAFPRPMR
ncbi:hypothetical protein TSMEX_005857 [Taenia solium]|eukprot:TsM_000821000 transcript=TsM_000821000 gene=TsM_000821000